jgi:hypothetical protein
LFFKNIGLQTAKKTALLQPSPSIDLKRAALTQKSATIEQLVMNVLVHGLLCRCTSRTFRNYRFNY